MQKMFIIFLNFFFVLMFTVSASAETSSESQPRFWIGGETRFRYVVDSPGPSSVQELQGADMLEFRQRIKFGGTINETMTFNGRLSTTGGNKWGNTDYSSGSEIALDIMNVNMKNTLDLDNIRVGRSALDFFTNGLVGKPMNVDGILLNETFGEVRFSGWTGNIKSSDANGDANQLTTAQLGGKLAKDLSFKTGYYWADVPGTSTPTGMGTLNTNTGSFTNSKGWTGSCTYKLGGYTMLFDYVDTTLVNPVGLSGNPKGWAVQFSNSQGPPVFYPAVLLVNPAKVGSGAWMVSYRSVDAGALPNGAGGFDTTAVAYPSQPYNIFLHGTDNVNVLFLAYQNVLAKNAVLSLEYQDFKIKDRSLTGLTSDGLNKTFMAKMEFFY